MAIVEVAFSEKPPSGSLHALFRCEKILLGKIISIREPFILFTGTQMLKTFEIAYIITGK